MASYGGLEGILSGLTKSTDHPSTVHCSPVVVIIVAVRSLSSSWWSWWWSLSSFAIV